MKNVEREAIQYSLQRDPKWKQQRDAAERMAVHAQQTYKTHGERAALRCALGDAASLCDALIRDIEGEYQGRGGRISILGTKLTTTAKQCAEAIWLMRERITMPDETVQQRTGEGEAK